MSLLVYLDVSGIPFETRPGILQRMSWAFVLIDNMDEPATDSPQMKKALASMSSSMAYVPSFADERDFRLYMSSRANHSSRKGKRKVGARR
jgi:hypothetical protein